MSKMRELVADLEARQKVVRAMGGPDKVEKQHARGKMSARERFAAFFDDGVFFEIGTHGTQMGLAAGPGGDDKPPAWLLNVEASGDVQVSMGGKAAEPWKARVATPEERARMWPVIAGKHKNYAGYQTKTDREIPLVLLTPA